MPEIQISKEKAAALYRTMKLIRCFEESVKRDYLNKELLLGEICARITELSPEKK